MANQIFFHVSRRISILILATDLSHCKLLVPGVLEPFSAPGSTLQSKQMEIPRGYLQLLTKLPLPLAGPVDNILLH